MTADPTEQTDSFGRRLPAPGTCHDAVYQAWLYGSSNKNSSEICEALGIDPSMPLSMLAEDLAIAARVRACEVAELVVLPGGVTDRLDGYRYATGLLAYLLNGEQPHV